MQTLSTRPAGDKHLPANLLHHRGQNRLWQNHRIPALGSTAAHPRQIMLTQWHPTRTRHPTAAGTSHPKIRVPSHFSHGFPDEI